MPGVGLQRLQLRAGLALLLTAELVLLTSPSSLVAGLADGASSDEGGSPELHQLRPGPESPVGGDGTVLRLAEGACSTSDCRMLVTGCGRSGTHYVAGAMEQAGLDILHEDIGSAGAVSWLYAAPLDRGAKIPWEKKGRNPSSGELRADPGFSFFPVFHLVRHPLDAIASLAHCFCGCGSLVSADCRGGAPSDATSWEFAARYVDLPADAVNQTWAIDHELHPPRRPGLLKSLLTEEALDQRLRLAMAYWTGWNKLCQAKAQYRFQLETVDLFEVLSLAGLHPKPSAKIDPFRHHGADAREPLSWEDLRRADPGLEAEVWALAQEYGYGREGMGGGGKAVAAAAAAATEAEAKGEGEAGHGGETAGRGVGEEEDGKEAEGGGGAEAEAEGEGEAESP